MGIKVHHMNNSKSIRIVWLLEELGVTYEIEHHRRQETQAAPEHLREIHYLGKAPIVEIDGHVMAESGAIVELLVARYGDGKFSPAVNSPLYPKYLEMLHYPESSLSAPMFVGLLYDAFGLDNEMLLGFAQASADLHLGYVEACIKDTGYLVGDSFTAADLQITFLLQGQKARGKLQGRTALLDYIDHMEARPAWQRALEKSNNEFNLKFF